MLEPGDSAPDFTLSDQHGDPVTLSALRGAPVVLYFYPRAGTPGCTTQACGVRDHRSELAATGAAVYGISTDAPEKLAGFDSAHGLGFPLLSDPDHAVAEAYGTWVEKSMYGRTHMGVQRATFVLDPEGVVREVIPRARPKTHAEDVLAALARIEAAP